MKYEFLKNVTLTDDLEIGLTTRNAYVKYKNSITYRLKVMANVKFFCGQTDKRTDRQTDRVTRAAHVGANARPWGA